MINEWRVHWQIATINPLVLAFPHLVMIILYSHFPDGRGVWLTKECLHKGKYHKWTDSLYPSHGRNLSFSFHPVFYFTCSVSIILWGSTSLWHHKFWPRHGILVFWHAFVLMRFVLNWLVDCMKIFFHQQLHP